jgi:methyltransferase (TIGR00027 family)
MAKPDAGSTALGTATLRLIEQFQPEGARLFTDPLAHTMVSTLIRVLMKSARIRNFAVRRTERIMQGLYGAQVCRTRYIDDAVENALSKGIGQLVILGAGFDTRPYRLANLERVKVFEVDLPSVQEDKKKRLQKYFGGLPENVAFVPMDFDTQSLEDALTSTALEASRPVVFVWEGVTQYTSEEAVRRTLGFVRNSAPRSVLIFTYVLKSIIEGHSDIPGGKEIMEVVAKNNAPWVFGLEPSSVASFLTPFHLSLIEDVGSLNYQERYLKPLGRTLNVSEAERTVQAMVIDR